MIEIIRVEDPGFELVLPSDEGTAALLAGLPWLRPHFVTDDGSLRIGSSATVIRAGDTTVLYDPFLAFDDPSRAHDRLAALAAAGVEPGDVDVVVNSHIDGLGLNLREDGSPTFERARYLVPVEEIEGIRSGDHPEPERTVVVELADAGRIEASHHGDEVAPGLRLEDAPGHNPGQHVLWVEDGGEAAVVVGHLFLHPAQIAAPEIDNGDRDPVALAQARRTLLARCVDTGATLIGPLFTAPGGGQVRSDGDTWRLET